MATLVLTAVGSVLGGPIGGALGALVGQQIDQQIFRPKGREGPRLQDLRIQGSSYGSTMPKLFGTMRIAGTIIWSTDLIETRTRQGGGKGRASTTRYSYSCSFAILLSARPILGVRRIWADGELLRGEAGDWKVPTGFRVHLGGAEQPVDPLIAAIEGATSAYRDCAYAVFEHLPLETFGNRIPALTFEVVADVGGRTMGQILAELSDNAVAGTGGAELAGFAAASSRLGSLVELLDAASALSFEDRADGLALADDDGAVTALAANEIAEDSRDLLGGEGLAPVETSIAYFDPSRDYQTGLQRARRPGPGTRRNRIDLPAALDAGAAKQLAERNLAQAAARRATRTLRCGWSRLPLSIGARIATPDGATWRVTSRSIARDGVTFDLSGDAGRAPRPVTFADAGRSVRASDCVQGATTVHLLDLPLLGDAGVEMPRLWIAAAGVSPGWRRADLLASIDAGASWTVIGDTAAPAIMGRCLGTLAPATEYLRDEAGDATVELLHAEMLLADADDGQLSAGANLALIGDELVQFGRARPLQPGRWQLSRLLRGRRGTGWAAGGHRPNERFVLLDADALAAWDAPLTAIGGTVRLLASGVGDPSPVEADAVGVGAAVRPLPPVQLRALRQADGGFALSWIRQSRIGFRWLDGTDAPLGEEREAYALTLTCGDGSTRVVELAEAGWRYAAADVLADRARGDHVTIAVVQRGTHAMSRASELILSLIEEPRS